MVHTTIVDQFSMLFHRRSSYIYEEKTVVEQIALVSTGANTIIDGPVVSDCIGNQHPWLPYGWENCSQSVDIFNQLSS